MKESARLIAVVIIIMLLPAMLLSLDAFRLDDQVDPFVVSSGAASANVTLSQDLYGDETRNVSISSNVTTDAPIASTYTTATNVLFITGLDSTETHYLTVTYKIEGLSDYWAAGSGSRVIPTLLILGIIVVIAGVGVTSFRRGE